MGVPFNADLLVAGDKERLTRSAALIENPLEYGHPLKDNMFLLGEVTREGNLITVDIDEDTPTVTFDDAVTKATAEVYGRPIPTIYQFAKTKTHDPRYSLLSGGSMIWVRQGEESRLALLQRQTYVKDDPAFGFVVAPGQYITPVGRSDKPLLQVCISEGAEELVLLAENESRIATPLLISFNGLTGTTPQQKMGIIANLRSKLEQRGEGHMMPLTAAEPQLIEARLRPEDEAKLCTIVTRVNGQVTEEFRCVAFHESAASTLQCNIPFEITVPEGLKISAFNGEAAGRQVRLMTPAEMAAEIFRKKNEPDTPGGIFVFVRGYLEGFGTDLPQDLCNKGTHYEGRFEDLQKVVLQRHRDAAKLAA